MAATHSPINILRSPVIPGLIPSIKIPKPQILWIGCWSSGVQETQTLELLPEEMIVHRNLGNTLSNNDLSTSSLVEYALRILKVKHIVVCGHYGCSFVSADSISNPVGHWLANIGELYESHRAELDRINSLSERNRRFAELHAWLQAKDLMRKENVMDAMRDRDLKVHAFMYDSNTRECVKITSDD